jgi:Glycosyl hydrolase family 26
VCAAHPVGGRGDDHAVRGQQPAAGEVERDGLVGGGLTSSSGEVTLRAQGEHDGLMQANDASPRSAIAALRARLRVLLLTAVPVLASAVLASAVLAGAVLAGAVLTGAVAPAEAGVVYTAASPPSPPGLQFGLYDQQISQFQWDTDGLPSPQIVVNYQAWEQNPASLIQFAELARGHGAEVFAELGTMGCDCGNVSLAGIAAGDYDSYLRSFAESVAAFGHPMLLTWDHEMNGSWYGWGPEDYSPSAWVAAWRHVYSVIHPIAPNAVWVWAPNTEYGAVPVTPYWPGSQYVNEWGLDCYLAAPGQTFASQCGATIAAIRSLTHDPGILAETGIENWQDRPARAGQLVQAAKSAGLTGLVWFDKGGSYLYSPGEQAMSAALGQPASGQPALGQPVPGSLSP